MRGTVVRLLSLVASLLLLSPLAVYAEESGPSTPSVPSSPSAAAETSTSPISFDYYIYGYPRTLDQVFQMDQDVNLYFLVTSTDPIRQVTASYNGKVAQLSNGKQFCFDRFDCRPVWDTDLRIDDFPASEDTLVTLEATDANGRTQTATMTVRNINLKQLQVALTGPETLQAGEPFALDYGVVHQSLNIYEQSLRLAYDASKFEFQSAETLQAGTDITQQDNGTEGLLNLTLSSYNPDYVQGPVLRLRFRAKDEVPDGTAAAMALDAWATTSGGTLLSPQVSFNAVFRNVGKSALLNLIAAAQQLHDATAEGNHAGQVPAGQKAILQTAIDQAQAIADDLQATQPQVNLASVALAAAVQAFRDAIVLRDPITFDYYIYGYPRTLDQVFQLDQDVNMYFLVTSVDPIRKVTATYNGKTAELSHDKQFCFDRFDCRLVWDTNFLLADFPAGEDTLVTLEATDANGQTQTATMTIRNINLKQVQAALTGPDDVNADGALEVDYGLTGNTLEVYEQGLRVQYDAAKLVFESARTLQAGVNVTQQDQSTEGLLNLSLSSYDPAYVSGPVLRLRYRVKSDVPDGAAAAITLDAWATTSQGQRIAPPVSYSAKLHAVDRSALFGKISVAQALYDATREGTKVGQAPRGAKAALQSAIRLAQAAADDASATQSQVDQAAIVLDKAVASFRAAIVPQRDGDVDGDGKITANDLWIAVAALGIRSSSPKWEHVKYADMNHNGRIDAWDVAAIASIVHSGR
ncbi:cohesin domain-containing protein [Cohnella nanjingensis]|uniref:EF-hand domain-containing protein n=1 Tax=Cohnella nanjingensis TaxID=1387779 RepID=A0A7X0RWL7_9BACL|nr:cohesin domain-containing protein [Cohnella nanjingensis]MBB6673695.1 hypothetical protein [Cohnella nanjingensis]